MSRSGRTRVAIYGAGGYTGRLLAEGARAHGLTAVLAGRRRGPLERLAASLGFPVRIATVDEPAALADAFADAAVVVNCAGPFETTAAPVLAACLSVGADYLDVAGEWPVIAKLAERAEEAERAGVMVMPGAGFVYAASDCLSLHVARRLPGARYLRLGFSRGDRISRGSFVSMLGLAGGGAPVRRNGEMRRAPVGRLERRFDFGAGPRAATAIAWPDAYALHRSTGIADIEAYLEAPGWLRWLAPPASALLGVADAAGALRAAARLSPLLPDGPSPEARDRTPKIVVAEVEDNWRRQAAARLRTPNVYAFTQSCVLAIVARALSGERQPGFRTPAEVYGPDFVLSLPGVAREDLPSWGSSEADAGRA